MNHRLSNSSDFSLNTFQTILRPTEAWTAIIALLVVTLLGSVAGAGKILNFIFPAGAFTVGIILYFRAPILYIGFTWWMWFITPLVRRLADYRSSFTDPSPILLAPFLVTIITLYTVLQYLTKSHKEGNLPFIFCLISLFYSFMIGLIQHSPVTVIIKLLDWVAPVLFGFHLSVNWRNYPHCRQNIQRTFFWGVLVMGVYGIIQYLFLPEWDRFWIIKSEMASAGSPKPFLLNVHSTMNDRGTFAIFMMAGLLLLFSSQGSANLPVSAAGLLSLMLTTVRTSWIGFLLGIIAIITSVKSSVQMRLILILLLTALCSVPLTTMEPFSGRIKDRIESFSNLQEDTSFQARGSIYEDQLNNALTNFAGDGIGGGTGDSGFLTILLQLGWLGAIFYCGGIVMMIFNLFKTRVTRLDSFASTARAIVLSTISMLPIGNLLDGVDGIIFWSFLGIGLAGNNYHIHQITRDKN
ncbi:MAG TPA: glucose-6-phosphate isomerase [Cyanobacteria bacterium UBA11149]|nr:glucose-6-phosphate isomerase [Cyanobacteria bacterium UBA11367]HBE56168.1 glucose-6-phosphate isomerase [Cyanobacteria bacterium UBA11366]HBK62189.1 glucose-6-phosphate isomerase [Cyanobacteria bacterium UBA11166]HBR73902.1 glucose-6-phosphate isomerase [Cyanobacteria bacterium UBA11159]HBS70213.1 glucose-6-phosphate isomerase [Cyanobacteria bacterium UBA11153]HBW90846.1 glucose-6-phosphate isomerase [Cyanobacteria bacterium UBA11149]HCA96340.1 glucose-6-phosphate isomerase [Cyanobacteria